MLQYWILYLVPLCRGLSQAKAFCSPAGESERVLLKLYTLGICLF